VGEETSGSGKTGYCIGRLYGRNQGYDCGFN